MCIIHLRTFKEVLHQDCQSEMSYFHRSRRPSENSQVFVLHLYGIQIIIVYPKPKEAKQTGFEIMNVHLVRRS